MGSNKKIFILIGVILVAIALWSIFFSFGPNSNSDQSNPNSMNILSPAFNNGGIIPDSYTCRGNGYNPPLEIHNVPGSAVSLALVVDDPDAPAGDFTHWVIWNIDRETTRIDEGVPPARATEGENSIGQSGYIAPCPPSGTHHYHFQLYALDKELELPETADKQDLEGEMTGHIVARAELVGLVSAQTQ